MSACLVRVDVMCLDNGKMVVNEFESLEAMYRCKEDSRDTEARCFLRSFWHAKLHELLRSLNSRFA